MSTVAPAALKQLASDWEKLWKSAQISGIVGDAAHAGSGYHVSRQDCRAGDYSTVRPDDLYGPGDAAAAIDMSMNTADMITCTNRLIKAHSNSQDPRRKYLNAFNGTTDGRQARRWDVYARSVQSATSDHLWHVHLEIRRRWVNSVTAMKAILSILRGETITTYLKAAGVADTKSVARSSVPPFPGILRRDDTATSPNPSVKLVQECLRKRGWVSQGPSDGFFGAKLETTVKKWQTDLKLTADGIIGPKTWPTFWDRPIAM